MFLFMQLTAQHHGSFRLFMTLFIQLTVQHHGSFRIRRFSSLPQRTRPPLGAQRVHPNVPALPQAPHRDAHAHHYTAKLGAARVDHMLGLE